MGKWMTKVVNTQNQVAVLVNKVEEFSNKLEQLTNESKETIFKLDKKIEVLVSLIKQLVFEQKYTVTLGETPFNPLRSTSNTVNEDGTVGKTENPKNVIYARKCSKSLIICKHMIKTSILKRRGIKINSINVTNVFLHL